MGSCGCVLLCGKIDLRSKAVILGGENVHHLLDYLLETSTLSALEVGLHSNLTEAKLWPSWLNCPDFISQLWGIVVDGLMDSYLEQFFDVCELFQPEVVAVDLMQEELNNMVYDDTVEMVCSRMLEFCFSIMHRFAIQTVIIAAPLPRTGGLMCSFEEYATQINLARKSLCELAEQSEGIYFGDFPNIMVEGMEMSAVLSSFSSDMHLPGLEFYSDGFQLKEDFAQLLREGGYYNNRWQFDALLADEAVVPI